MQPLTLGVQTIQAPNPETTYIKIANYAIWIAGKHAYQLFNIITNNHSSLSGWEEDDENRNPRGVYKINNSGNPFHLEAIKKTVSTVEYPVEYLE